MYDFFKKEIDTFFKNVIFFIIVVGLMRPIAFFARLNFLTSFLTVAFILFIKTPAKHAYERWLKPFNQKLFKKFDNVVISKITKVYASYSQLFLNFIQDNPLKYAYYLLSAFSLTLCLSLNGILISFVYTHGYIPNDSLGTKQFNQLGYVYKPYISKLSNISWANNCNNKANNNQTVKIVKNQSQANFANDPANDIFRECSKVNTYSTDQDQAEELFRNVLNDVLLKDKQFYIQGNNALLSYAPSYDQILDHMNSQKNC